MRVVPSQFRFPRVGPPAGLFVVLVFDAPHYLLQDVLHGHIPTMVPNSSTTMAMCELPVRNSSSIWESGLVSGATRCGRRRRFRWNARLERPGTDRAAALFPHREQIFVMEDADDLLRRALVHGQAGVTVLDHGAQHVVEIRAGRNGDNIVARGHDLAYRDGSQIQHAVDHILLGLGQISEAAAGTDDQLQLLAEWPPPWAEPPSRRARVITPAERSITTTKGARGDRTPAGPGPPERPGDPLWR